MYLEASQIFQLSVGLIGAILILVAAYAAPMKVSIAILLVMIPFQPIETRFGSVNVLMTYVLFFALLLRGRLRYVPMLGPMLLVLFAYLVVVGQLHSALYFDHGLYVFFLISGLLVFILTYNMAQEVENPRYIVGLLLAANVGAVIYCLIQFTVPPGERMTFFGSDDLWMHRNRADKRLLGPFGSAEVTSAYFMSMTVLLVYEILHAQARRRLLLAALAAANVAMIIGTASRGGFLVLIGSLLLFVYFFRRQLGVMRAVQVLIASSMILVATGIVVTTQTEFSTMFSRLEQTSIEGGIPDTRQIAWTRTWAAIQEKPWFGHGPYLISEHTLERSGRSKPPEQLVMSYPHNLYLHLLLTVGLFGAFCMLLFLFAITWRTYKGVRLGNHRTEYEKGLIVVGMLLAIGFFTHELIIEFLRQGTVDYIHFRFALFGIFLGLADRARARRHESRATELQSDHWRIDVDSKQKRHSFGAAS